MLTDQKNYIRTVLEDKKARLAKARTELAKNADGKLIEDIDAKLDAIDAALDVINEAK